MKISQKTIDRKDKFEKLDEAISAITSNDPYWRSALTPNPWRALTSSETECHPWARELGAPVMQLDTGPGLCRKEEGRPHVGFDVDGNYYCDE